MLKIRKANFAIALLVTIFLAVIIPLNTAVAATVSLNVGVPAEVPQGNNFIVSIDIGTVTSLKSWQFDVTYPKDSLRVPGNEGAVGASGVSAGQIGITALGNNTWSYTPTGSPGTISIKGQNVTAISGQGYLAKIAFTATGNAGTKCDIALANVVLVTELRDGTTSNLTANVTTGKITITASTKTTTPATTSPTGSPKPTTSSTASPSPSTSQSPRATSPAASTTPTASKTTAASATAAANMAASSTPTSTSTATSSPGANSKIIIAVPPRVQPLEEFVIRIDIDKTSKLDSFHFILEYDPEVMEVRSVTAGMIGSTVTEVTEWSLTPPETQGKAEVMGIIPGGKGVSGSGYLVKIHCQMIGEMGKNSDLTLAEVELTGPDGEALGVDPVMNKSISVEATKLSIAVPEKVPADGQFEALINVSQIIGLASYNIIVTYNPSVIEIIGVNPGMIGGTEVPVDDWDYMPPGEQGQIYIKGAFEEDSEGVRGTGEVARLQCQVVGRLSQRSPITLKSIELMDKEGKPIQQSPAVNGSVLIANTPFFASLWKLIIVIVAGVIIIGLVLFFILRKLRHRGVRRADRPVQPRGKVQKVQKVENPDDLMEVMRNRITQLPPRGSGRKSDSGDKQQK